MFQQLPLNENRQQRNYSLASQSRTIESTFFSYFQFSYNQFYILKIFFYFVLGGTNYIALVAGIICIIGLLLPTEGEQSLSIPEYLHLSINFKLILSFVLGNYFFF